MKSRLHVKIIFSSLLIFAAVLAMPSLAVAQERDTAESIQITYDISSASTEKVPPEDAELVFSVYQEGVPISSEGISPYACTATALANVRAYRVSRNGKQYVDLYVGLSAPFGTCVRIKGVRNGSLQWEDITTGRNAAGQSFSGSQIVPAGFFHLYVDGIYELTPTHSYDVAWSFDSWLYNGRNSHYNGSETFFYG